MWKLLWTESRYNRMILTVALTVSLICFIVIWFGVKFEHNHVPFFLLIILIASLFVHFATEGKRSKEQRNRLHGFLPIQSIKVYATRLLLPIFTWISVGVLLILTHGIVQPFSNGSLAMPSGKQLFSVNGLILIVSAAYLINIDMKTAFSRGLFKILAFIIWAIFYIAALIPFFILTDFAGTFGQHTPLQRALFRFLSSTSGSLFLTFLGLVLVSIGLSVFTRRKTYV